MGPWASERDGAGTFFLLPRATVAVWASPVPVPEGAGTCPNLLTPSRQALGVPEKPLCALIGCRCGGVLLQSRPIGLCVPFFQYNL